MRQHDTVPYSFKSFLPTCFQALILVHFPRGSLKCAFHSAHLHTNPMNKVNGRHSLETRNAIVPRCRHVISPLVDGT